MEKIETEKGENYIKPRREPPGKKKKKNSTSKLFPRLFPPRSSSPTPLAPDDDDDHQQQQPQKDMLEDHTRTGAYAAAILGSARACFEGKTVLDVGAGSGILSIFAARAGAKKVFAVEATPMAAHARTLIKHNKLDHVIEVLQGTVESIELPEKVDVIVSEWMGYLLLRESMLDSVLAARDAWLKPGGSLWPSHARLLLAPARSTLPHARAAELQNAMQGW